MLHCYHNYYLMFLNEYALLYQIWFHYLLIIYNHRWFVLFGIHCDNILLNWYSDLFWWCWKQFIKISPLHTFCFKSQKKKKIKTKRTLKAPTIIDVVVISISKIDVVITSNTIKLIPFFNQQCFLYFFCGILFDPMHKVLKNLHKWLLYLNFTLSCYKCHNSIYSC